MTDMRVGIVGQRDNARAQELVAQLKTTLDDSDVEVSIDEVTADALAESGVPPTAMTDCDLAVSIGGDGTLLYTARAVKDTPIVGVNLGEVGFLNPVAPEEARSIVQGAIAAHRAGTLSVQELPRLAVAGNDWELTPAINEVVIQGRRRAADGGATVTVTIDNEEYTAERADGVLVATPTGSTAYNLSEGGPLVHPNVDGMLTTIMCPDAGTRSLVVGETTTIEIELTDATTCHVVGDGQERRSLEPPVTVTVEVAETPLRLAGPTIDFFDALNKLDPG